LPDPKPGRDGAARAVLGELAPPADLCQQVFEAAGLADCVGQSHTMQIAGRPSGRLEDLLDRDRLVKAAGDGLPRIDSLPVACSARPNSRRHRLFRDRRSVSEAAQATAALNCASVMTAGVMTAGVMAAGVMAAEVATAVLGLVTGSTIVISFLGWQNQKIGSRGQFGKDTEHLEERPA
jgi:hypothetical protein